MTPRIAWSRSTARQSWRSPRRSTSGCPRRCTECLTRRSPARPPSTRSGADAPRTDVQAPPATTASSLDDFVEAALAFLEQFPPRRGTARTFRWGEGSDEVRLFQEPDPAEQEAELGALRAW